MDQKQNNPLSKHFRQPALYMKLPSGGHYWGQNAIELPVSGEIPVYPMTARDEITIRTPDALLNGQGVIDVIQSCCPNIKNAWATPSMDMDAILLHIRIASYGNRMDMDTECPHCKAENTFTLDLDVLMERTTVPDYNQPVMIEGLTIKLRPQPYIEVNKANQVTFTEQQILRTINDDAVSEEVKKAKTDEWLKKLIALNIQICANCTESITTEDGTVVTEPGYIREFYDMADFKVMRSIQDRLKAMTQETQFKPVDAACKECTKSYTVPIDFDYSNFFA